MGKNHFSDDVIRYIEQNEKSDLYQLLLKKSPIEEVDMETIVRQIQGRQIAKKKFPFLLEYDQYQFPKKVSLEQSSSEQTAVYKSGLMSGGSFIDLTGGMGIDCYLLGRKFSSCTYVEPNEELFESTMDNFLILGYDQCSGLNSTAEEALRNITDRFDWVYLDPSRRVEGNRKTSIANYEPNVLSLKDQLLKAGKKVMIKLSPMQDISECIVEMKNVDHIWVISLKNDVKELLIQLGQEQNSNPSITAIDLSNVSLSFTLDYKQRVNTQTYTSLGKYLYQPAPALVKAEIHKAHATRLKLNKLNANTQLFTSDELVENYFGRVFEVLGQVKSNKKDLQKYLPGMKANIITKNYPLTPQQLSKKLKISDGGDMYVIAFSDRENKKVITVCRRLS